jgi:PilZ domain-containing protein
MSITPERRRTRRRGVNEHGTTARIRPGQQVQLTDLSSGGALVEADRRMLPGSAVELQLLAQDRQATMRGSVLRCCVVRVRPSSVSYRGAIAFDRQLAWFGDTPGYDVPFGGEVTPLGI